jgi:predicted dehydrogenase
MSDTPGTQTSEREIERQDLSGVPPVRWGFVGTGSIASSMAGVTTLTPLADLAAVSSRNLASAISFARKHSVSRTYASWQELIADDGIDAIYVATPTSVREEICIAAANAGKHVLAEKPFASAASVKRIAVACLNNDVAFMDGTHFVHHPRTATIRDNMSTLVGWPWSVDTAFQFELSDRDNIRYDPDLEPLGAIGDAGWYNMRAAVEYLAPNIKLRSVTAYLRRDLETGAVIGGSGIMEFDDGSTSTWNCGFDSGAAVSDLRISGNAGSINITNFLGEDGDGSASYLYRRGGGEPGSVSDTVRVASSLPGAALMFEDFACLVHNPSLREASTQASERTQHLLDAVWKSALQNEQSES